MLKFAFIYTVDFTLQGNNIIVYFYFSYLIPVYNFIDNALL